jgi:hypothetical protein
VAAVARLRDVYLGALEHLLRNSYDPSIGDYPGCETHEFLGVVAPG